jgi:hypothetical protein
VLDGLVDGVGERGGALVVRGEAGIGKSALLAAASTRATEHGITVLTTTGVQTEAHLPVAGCISSCERSSPAPRVRPPASSASRWRPSGWPTRPLRTGS